MKDQPGDNPADALEEACSRAIAQWRAWQLAEKAAARQPLKKRHHPQRTVNPKVEALRGRTRKRLKKRPG